MIPVPPQEKIKYFYSMLENFIEEIIDFEKSYGDTMKIISKEITWENLFKKPSQNNYVNHESFLKKEEITILIFKKMMTILKKLHQDLKDFNTWAEEEEGMQTTGVSKRLMIEIFEEGDFYEAPRYAEKIRNNMKPYAANKYQIWL